jgi:signal peptidase I
VQVGENEVFLIGDNRPMSFDSRMFGPIDRDLIRGKAMVVIWPFDSITLL